MAGYDEDFKIQNQIMIAILPPGGRQSSVWWEGIGYLDETGNSLIDETFLRY